jgi:hypothetical protein
VDKGLYFNNFEMAVFHNKLIDELVVSMINLDEINAIDNKMQVNINRSIRWNIQLSVNKNYL